MLIYSQNTNNHQKKHSNTQSQQDKETLQYLFNNAIKNSSLKYDLIIGDQLDFQIECSINDNRIILPFPLRLCYTN